MSETISANDTADQKKAAASIFGAVINTGVDPLLKAQTEILASVEATVNGWFQRRREAVIETQNLVARLRATTDPAAFLSVQQEWVSGAVHRLTADATAYQSAAQQLVDSARTWFPQVIENGVSGAAAATAEAVDATRAAGKPFRVPAAKAS